MNTIQAEVETRRALAAELSTVASDATYAGQKGSTLPDWHGRAAYHLIFAAVNCLQAAQALTRADSSGYPIDKFANAQDFMKWAFNDMRDSECFTDKQLKRLY